ncbi:MAG TPA: hypothetical protein VK137_18175, partial [Planctomycetaceae bacterium]|nr:hypothetical protein [Planctomycetaceae bacterium]
GVSAHYGLVAWNPGDVFHRVHVNVPADVPRDLSWLYRFVPEAARERHARAVDSLRSLGGHVDARWETVKYDPLPRPFNGWETLVFLSDSWRGGDEGLRHLADVHQPSRLYLVRAPITDAGLKYLAPLKTLEILHVEETQATDAGLEVLRNLTALKELRLEGTAGGGEIGDAALKHLDGLPSLHALTVYGPKFTDAGLPNLLTIPQLRSVRLLDTKVSKEGTRAFRTKRFQVGFTSDIPW